MYMSLSVECVCNWYTHLCMIHIIHIRRKWGAGSDRKVKYNLLKLCNFFYNNNKKCAHLCANNKNLFFVDVFVKMIVFLHCSCVFYFSCFMCFFSLQFSHFKFFLIISTHYMIHLLDFLRFFSHF